MKSIVGTRAESAPILLDSSGASSDPATPEMLERTTRHSYQETWLQALVHRHPSVLPIHRIEPELTPLIAVAREVPLGSGFADNLLVTPRGGIVLVETKLWRNAQARREVVAQMLDYAASLTALTLADLETACRKGQESRLGDGGLHALVSAQGDAPVEAEFCDAVERNLRRGRIMLMAVGDGIREATAALGDMFDRCATTEFTFAFVELVPYDLPDGRILVIPRVPLRTEVIVRGIVEIHDERIVRRQPETARPATQTSQAFWESFTLQNPNMVLPLRDLLKRLEPLGVHDDYVSSLNLKFSMADGRIVNLGYVRRDGRFATEAVTYSAPREPAIRYLQNLAKILGGNFIEAPGEPRVMIKGRTPYFSEVHAKASEVEQAMKDYLIELSDIANLEV